MSDRHAITIADFWFSDCYLIALRGSTQTLAIIGTLVCANLWAVTWGGAKRMGGGKRTRERTLPKIFGPLQKSFWSALSWLFVQEKQSTDT